eukprot:CAMPEP_0117758670 /NCGR_PEP_ID=MMETSP0947-20121206/15536_1 /TAXON_ID=44440 /ORGANISM="Chattonella subsalsa, Strain CCMP2191" /LENGTH=89 /DNA_ID=CAMNT_0005578941 /DNA_START=280 /DNA_END=549 /DNA_ORIENTATION=+
MAEGLSPGAGLATADEQSDAAYADLINTCVDQQKLSLNQYDIDDLAQGGTMWEQGVTKKKSKGILGDLGDVFKALAGGAHIERKEDGRI